MCCLAFVAFSLSLSPVAVVSPSALPPALQPYLQDGRFDPGDYGWMRGAFPEATPEWKAAETAIGEWLGRCVQSTRSTIQAELKQFGVTLKELGKILPSDPVCFAVATRPNPLDFDTYGALREAAVEARPYSQTYLYAVSLAEKVGGSSSHDLGDQLQARSLGEQMLRIASSWGAGDGLQAPRVPQHVAAVVNSQLLLATAELDRRNTAWLKGVVEKSGWPRVSNVGKGPSTKAWLLVQHSDHDPAFQLRVLRLMEPLVSSAEVDSKNYAYLFDRVMLKIAGKQRYATQMTCKAGRREPLPLENAAKVARYRAAVNLPPLSEYIALMNRIVGPCPRDGRHGR